MLKSVQWRICSPGVGTILRILPASISAFSGRLRSALAISSLAPQLRCFRQHPRLLVGSVGASGRWREGEFHRLLAAQLRTDQIALVATQPQQQQHLVVDGLGTGLRREAIRLVAFHDRRRDLHDESLAEEVGHVPERIDREGRGLVLRFVLDQEIVCRLLDGFPSLVAGFLFNDLAVTRLQSLALAAFLHDGRAACWRCRWNSCRVACRPLPSAASCDSLEPILGDESEEFQGGSMRTLFTAFPLAHQTRCHVQISGENRLARALPQTKGADFRRLQWLHWCKTQVIEFTHRCVCPLRRRREDLRQSRESTPSEDYGIAFSSHITSVNVPDATTRAITLSSWASTSDASFLSATSSSLPMLSFSFFAKP